ncbi:MAG: SDR family NAD(P)-dependent oxidoreductase, partial [Chloroflexi bacterium]|nr:SDR family NAD(P)-dependent oxidoreductase [Chloroflexota bacterium]
MRLRDKVALVTGGSRGNGRAIALGLAREGADVAISYAQAATAADEVVAETRALGRRGVAVPADTGRRADVERLVARVVEELGRIDILFNNGGVLTRAPFLETSEEAWDRVMDVNLKGYFLVGQAVARTMVERRIAGSIVNVSSVYAQRGAAGVTPYVDRGGRGRRRDTGAGSAGGRRAGRHGPACGRRATGG